MLKISLLLFVLIPLLFFGGSNKISDLNPENLGPLFKDAPASILADGNGMSRQEWENMRLCDPSTGIIPSGMRRLEMQFASTLPKDIDYLGYKSKLKTALAWDLRGPWNVGGRTRAFAIDISNSNHLIAVSVSGGIWQSFNGGNSWTKTSPSNMHFGASTIIQDTRPGKTNTWYIGTGEGYGTSASGSGAFFLGNGMYKSIDGGASWQVLASTSSNTPHQFDQFWDVMWNIAIDPSDTINDIVYAATLGRIYRSADGGNTWVEVLKGSTYSYFTDIAVTPTGIVYATMSSDGSKEGIFRSDNGINWTNITSDSFALDFNRIVIGINPLNENSVYFLANTPGYGQESTSFRGRKEWNSLWKYQYKSGDGSDTGGVWTNLSNNIPAWGGPADQFFVQGSYDMVISIKPNDSNTVFIGGTNLYKSTDGFTSDSNITHIGGYKPGTNIPMYEVVYNHHPDQHGVAFHPSNPDILFSYHDGGISKTVDCTVDSIVWVSLNNGYVTSQFYTIAIDHGTPTNDIIIGGLQDNGSHYTRSTNPQTFWPEPSLGDGSFCAIDDGHQYYYFSRQNGKMMKAQLDTSGNVLAFNRIDPAYGKGYLFINPFILDPNNNNKMYLAAGNALWRNDDLSQIALNNQYDSITTNWTEVIDTLTNPGIQISALAVSENNPSNRLYFGTSKRNVYRVDNANTAMQVTALNITDQFFNTGGYVSSISIDPDSADHVMVTFSNYNIYSIFFSKDGGTSWEKSAGNLEKTISGSGGGPSIRWSAIQKVGNKRVYWVATSTGVYATDTLRGTDTWWVQQGSQSIGNVVCDMIVTRESDGLVAIATHGNGIFTTYVTDVSQVAGTQEQIIASSSLSVKIWPVPAEHKINLNIFNPGSGDLIIKLYDLKGSLVFRRVEKNMPGGDCYFGYQINKEAIKPGIYMVLVETNTQKTVKKIIIK